MEIAALVSGGVDSSVMVPILKEQGFNPHIFYIKIGLEGKDDLMDCPSEEDIEITTYIAKKYGYDNLKFYVNDVTKGEVYKDNVDMDIFCIYPSHGTKFWSGEIRGKVTHWMPLPMPPKGDEGK